MKDAKQKSGKKKFTIVFLFVWLLLVSVVVVAVLCFGVIVVFEMIFVVVDLIH
jgi:hypothetical protein